MVTPLANSHSEKLVDGGGVIRRAAYDNDTASTRIVSYPVPSNPSVVVFFSTNRKDLVEDVNWPPRTPYEALISSPGGRKKAQEMQHRRRHTQTDEVDQHGSPRSGKNVDQLPDAQDDNADTALGGDDDDDDEETLQLKLEAIKARLKLKKLQQNKSKPESPIVEQRTRNAESTKPHHPPKSLAPTPVPENVTSPPRDGGPGQEDVQVLLSPTKRPECSQGSSPKRMMMGIGKGVRGGDVSLKWRSSGQKDTSFTGRQTNGSVKTDAGQVGRTKQDISAARPTSFTDRLLEQRSVDKAKRERAQKLHINRSSRFAVDRKELANFEAAASATETSRTPTHTRASDRRPTQQFSRDDVIHSYHQPNASARRNKPLPNSVEYKVRPQSSSSGNSYASHQQPHNTPGSLPRSSELANGKKHEGVEDADEKAPDSSKFEAYSGLHLSKRILPYSFLKRTLAEATPMRIPDLLRTIKPPSFDPPETEGDYVVFGIVASKSSPRDHKGRENATEQRKDPFDDGSNNTSKYMVLNLTDLKWSIDLFLFATAFPRYYKLSPGSLIAILNPSIMPPPPNKIDTNAFSLTVSSSDDTILEIGTANDLGFCKSVKKDGKVCESWVDARKTEFCDFHVELQLKRTKAQRMGVNSGTGILGERGGGRGSRGGKHSGSGRGRAEGDGLKNEGGVYDRSTGSTYYVVPSGGRGSNSNGLGQRSAAGLIDADDPFAPPSGPHQDKEERFRKRVADQQKEREIAKRLGELNKGVGSDYMRAHVASQTPATTSSATTEHHHPLPRQKSITSGNTGLQNDPRHTQTSSAPGGLDNLSRNASDVKLGRAKKRNFEPDKDTPRSANVGKKTRFITSKGIREAGRDSLGDTTMTTTAHDNDDDDDDLDIV